MHLLIAAAGSGRRMGGDINKLLLNVAGKPILEWTLRAALTSKKVEWIGIVGQPKDKSSILQLIPETLKPVKWIDGGSTRQESVQLGLASLPSDAQYVLIHDGARCLIEPNVLDRFADEVINGHGVIAATQVTDTIKKVNQEGVIIETPPRAGLWSAQTPQGFSVERLRYAHAEAIAHGWSVTDDASLFERLGWKVKIIETEPSNIKVTTPFDLVIAEALLNAKEGN